MKAGALIAVNALVIANAAQADPLTLHLICRGTGDHQVAHGAFGTAFGRHGTISAFGVSHSQDQFAEQMDIEIMPAGSKARVPRRFLPPAHGGSGGWFDIKDLVVADDAITGTVLINFTNHPKLRIDRRTGAVAMDGKVGAYAGDCESYDATKQERAF